MEERVTQFHTDAGRPRDAKTPKDIDRLRKFLFRNQEHRFTEREQSHLFQAVQLYVTAYTARQEDGDGDNPAAALLEDALKMPFTVFTTSHKKTMLKWLERLSGGGNAAGTTEGAFGSGGDSSDNSARWHDVIDIRDGAQAEVMDGDGETAVRNLMFVGSPLLRGASCEKQPPETGVGV